MILWAMTIMSQIPVGYDLSKCIHMEYRDIYKKSYLYFLIVTMIYYSE